MYLSCYGSHFSLRTIRQSGCKGQPLHFHEDWFSPPSSGHGLFWFPGFSCFCGCSSGVRSLRRKLASSLCLCPHAGAKRGRPTHCHCPGLSSAGRKAESCPFYLFGDCNCIRVWWCEQLFSLAHWPNCNRGGKIFSLPSPQNIEIFKGIPGGSLAS